MSTGWVAELRAQVDLCRGHTAAPPVLHSREGGSVSNSTICLSFRIWNFSREFFGRVRRNAIEKLASQPASGFHGYCM